MAVAGKKILLTTPYIPTDKFYDYWGTNISKFLRFNYIKRISYGLRFLKANIPGIDILEYPSWQQFADKLNQGYDIVGFSFYTCEVNRIQKMVNYARKKGIKEIWGGNYGVLNPGMDELFDRIFIGYSEREVADTFGLDIDRIVHPSLVEYVGLPFNLAAFPVAILYSSRGCNVGCSFCQTPSFTDSLEEIPLESIEDILKIYKKLKISEILVSDENFGLQKEHSEQTVELLDKYDMNWYAMTRVDILNKNIDSWYEKGFSGVFLGIESVKQSNLNKMNKNLSVSHTVELLEKLDEIKAMVFGFTIMGFEDDTEESIKKDIKYLVNNFNVDIFQLCVLTPFPRTALWDRIERDYGIFEDDWSKWDTKHLVWNHPNISPEKMEELLRWGFKYAYPAKKLIETPHRFYMLRKKRIGPLRAHIKMLADGFRANLRYKKPLPP